MRIVFSNTINAPDGAEEYNYDVFKDVHSEYSDAIDAFSKYLWDRFAKPIRRSKD